MIPGTSRGDHEKEEYEENIFIANFCVLNRHGLWPSNSLGAIPEATEDSETQPAETATNSD
ncbi:MAG TPA: hypothetical protein DCK93_10570 [Blastocatellia bacterium]|nr:hypothetical protein [Blastocatellia bacterium]HAF23331.1 hypothetical protein [Blastocatellia bacterium]